MKLICELIEDVNYLSEEKGDKKQLFIEGVFIQTEQKNKNGRIYRKPMMEQKINRYIREYVNDNRAYGELGHPSGPTINPDRISHRIVSLKEDGNNYVGKALIIENNPMGAIAKNIIESGGKLGVSTRGMGSLKEVNGIQEVQDDFYLATAGDIVVDPSAPSAFVNGIMEGVEWVCNNGIFKPVDVEAMQREIDESVRQRELTQQKTFKLFERFMHKMATGKVVKS